MTLRWRLTVAFVLVVLVPLLVGLALVVRAVPGAVQDEQAQGAGAAARLAAEVLRDYCERAAAAAEVAGRAAGTGDRAAAAATARALVARGQADGVRVLGPSGAVVATAGALPGSPVDCAGAPSAAQEPWLSAVLPLRTAQGRPAGRVVVAFSLADRVLPRLRDAVGDGAVVLLARGGAVVASSGRVPADVLRDAVRGSARHRGDPVTAYVPAARGQALGLVLVQTPERGPALLVDAGVVVLLAVLVAFGIALLSARTTTRPLAELGAAADRIAGGDLSTRIEVRSRDEVARLATAFNRMTDELRGYVGQLEASRDELQAGLTRLGETLSGTHDLDRILRVVLESAMAATRARSGMVLLLTPGGEELALAVSQGVQVPLDLRVALGEGISGRVAQSGEAVLGTAGDGPDELRPTAGEPSGTSVIAVPLRSSSTVIGVLDLFGSELPGGFAPTDLATIRTFAGQATVAIDNVLLHEEAQRLSITDGLTGLWNYRYFTMTVGKEIERAARFGRPLGLLILDLDHFKRVNDSFGHQRGDAVLVELADRLRKQVRDIDTLARYGGEELVVVLPETDVAGACHLAERVCEVVRRAPFDGTGEPPVHLTVSVGVAVFPDHAQAAGDLLARADEALYRAKAAGRDRWVLAEPAPSVMPD